MPGWYLTRRVAGLLLSVYALGGCAYFRGTDLSSYPPDGRTLFLHNFTNETFAADVNVELTEWVRREIGRRENFTLRSTREDARLWLYGEITVYRKEGRMFDNLRTPTRSELFVAGRVKLRRHPGEELILSREIGARVEYSESEGFAESEYTARQRLLQELARQINNAVEAGFVNATPQPAAAPTEK